MSQDFRNSTAQLAVDFSTGITITTNPGDNYMRLAVFVDNNNAYIKDASAFVDIDADHKIAVLNKNNYGEIVAGRLLTWMTDYFCTGNGYDAYVITLAGSAIGNSSNFTEEVKEDMLDILNKVKAIAYHKTCLVQDDTEELITEVLVYFAEICKFDQLLNSSPWYPHNASDPGDLESGPLYQGLKVAGADAFLSYHKDNERNGALFQLGNALRVVNKSGTPVGNGLDFDKTNLITPSGQPDPDYPNFVFSTWDDYNLNTSEQSVLEGANIAFFRTIGNGTGMVSAVGIKSINGTVVSAMWLVHFCDYVNKIKVAEIITNINTLRNRRTYGRIVNAMMSTIGRFGEESGAEFLRNVQSHAPAFDSLPPSGGREIIIPNAWEADYVFTVDTVKVYGNLTIAL